MPSMELGGFPPATTTYPGSMAAADKLWLNSMRTGVVNVLDYGADATGVNDCVAAFTSAIAALPAGGGIVFMPAGSYKFASSLIFTNAGVSLPGASRNNTSVLSK